MIRTLDTTLEQVELTEYKVEPLSKEDRTLLSSDADFSDFNNISMRIDRKDTHYSETIKGTQEELRSHYDYLEEAGKIGVSLGCVTSPIHFTDVRMPAVRGVSEKWVKKVYIVTVLPLNFAKDMEAIKLNGIEESELPTLNKTFMGCGVTETQLRQYHRLCELEREMRLFYLFPDSFVDYERFGVIDGRWSVWFYHGRFVSVADIPVGEVVTRVKHHVLKEVKAFKKLQAEVSKFERFEQSSDARRVQISDDVRMFVWKRDEGACVVCGSNENLEYDHIIPVSKGGSSNERNLQLLCEGCNREKGANI